MKDPQDKEIRPYEVLGVSPNIPIAEIQAAYTSFVKVRANIAKRSSAGIAKERLARPDRRLEDELFYYPSPSATVSASSETVIAPFRHEVLPPSLDIEVGVLVDAAVADIPAASTFCERIVYLSNVNQFTENYLSCLPIEFPS